MSVPRSSVRLYPQVSRVDRAVGDPGSPGIAGYGHRHALNRDRLATTPVVPAVLDRALRLSYLPGSAGGELRTLDETLLLATVAARRDGTLMPATMFSVTAATAVLIGGSAEQWDRVVRLLRQGGSIGLALSEPDVDTDPRAGTCRLDPDTGTLTGVKWRVGVACARPWLLVIARTGARGPGAFTAALLDGDQAHRAMTGAAADTDGFRGVRFAEARFDGLRAGPGAVVGARGRGLELTLRAMQLVRVLSTAASLGAADTALRGALDLVGPNMVGQAAGQRAESLGVAAAALFAAQVSALTAARGMHVVPDHHAVWSGTVKRVVTELVELVHRRVGDAIGFRALLRAPIGLAERDSRVVRHIDTDPIANLELLAQQLARRDHHGAPMPPERLRAIFTLGAALPEFEPSRLVLRAPEPFAVFDALPEVVADGRARARAAEQDRLDEELRWLVGAVRELRERLRRELSDANRPGRGLIRLAERFAYLHAAAEAACLWWANPELPLFGTPPGSTAWLVPVLTILRDLASGGRGAPPPEDAEAALTIASGLHRTGLLFAPPHIPLAESRTDDQG